MTALIFPNELPLTLGLNVIVRPGDEWHDSLVCGFAVVEPHKCTAVRAPQDWVALTGPCPTCKGTGNRNYDVDLDDMIVDDVSDEDCPDCRDGRRVVPLYTDCPQLDVHFAGDVDGWDECFYGCDDQHRLLVGWGSIEVIPVVADGYEGKAPFLLVDPDQNCAYYAPHEYRIRGGWEEVTLHFNPLPVPGRDFGIVIDCVEVAS